MKKISRTLAIMLALILILGVSCPLAFADDSLETPVDDPIEPAPVEKSVYSDIQTRIYTGIGKAQWLHITPLVTPNALIITMIDYSGVTVWQESFTAMGVTHWYVGANVQYVYLKGFPGGVVTVTNTDN